MGRPSVIHDNDIELAPPTDSGDISEATFFSSRVKLTLIESEIYARLHCCRSRQEPGYKRLGLVNDFDKRLREWRDTLPLSIRPEEPILCATEHIPHAVRLQFAYFNSVITLHRLSIYNTLFSGSEPGMNMLPDQDSDLPPQAYASHLTCLEAARHTAKLLLALDYHSHLPRDNVMR
jgi:hypothetical protein